MTTAAQAIDFTGAWRSSMELLVPRELNLSRLLVIGCGDPGTKTPNDWLNLGGFTFAEIRKRKARSVSIIVDIANTEHTAPHVIATNLALGALLRSYQFKKYRSAQSRNQKNSLRSGAVVESPTRIFIHCLDPEATAARFTDFMAIANGVKLARDVINEPANVLGPVEFANRVASLADAGVDVEVLNEESIKNLGMGALLAVAQGSVRPPRVVIMKWLGNLTEDQRPLVFVGKGVTFDTGGLSIKTAEGLEGMKGDMSGAACVSGLMLSLAQRKAKINAIGVIGCVENMTSGSAYRPGDIVRSMSGQTIEVINTDAEGRLVLADLIWYAQWRFRPKLMIDLATLTGAIIGALGKEHAGLFCNDEKLAQDLLESSKRSGELIWRMPLDSAYDELIKSSIADMKNMGSKYAPACAAAQFIQKFVRKTPWAHIDIAGPVTGAPDTDINGSWGAGWGVRLLDEFIATHHEHPARRVEAEAFQSRAYAQLPIQKPWLH